MKVSRTPSGTFLTKAYREEHSMDQCRSRLKLSENFERHWSKVSPYTGIGPWMALPRLTARKAETEVLSIVSTLSEGATEPFPLDQLLALTPSEPQPRYRTIVARYVA